VDGDIDAVIGLPVARVSAVAASLGSPLT